MTIIFDIPYLPTSWASPRLGQASVFSPSAKAKKDVILLIKSLYDGDIIFDPVKVEFKFYFVPPKAIPKKYLPEYYRNERPCLVKKDCTNLQKFLEDCLQHTVIRNDSRVVKISSEKLWANKSHMLVRIERLFTLPVKNEKEKTK
jgi:Holliday junction resolvase RusA-like endonuclease